MVEDWISRWERDGLGPWIVRGIGGPRILGRGGCAIRGDAEGNLPYRGPDAHNPGRGGTRLVHADRDLGPGDLARIVR